MIKQRVLLGMSGGIDSTLAVLYLRKMGYEVVGLTLDFNINSQKQNNSMLAVKQLADLLKIEHYIIDVSKEFNNKVINYFINEYLTGKTPSPCVYCNKNVKIKYLIDYADKYNCQKIATGHYVRLVLKNGFYYIQKGIDTNKDQSYFLWNLNQDSLSKCIFPLGDKCKSDILNKAKEIGIKKNIENKESMSVCFLQGKDYREFLNEKLPNLKNKLNGGIVKDSKGQIIGKHQGFPYYTIGQKRGLNLNPNIQGQYVAKIDAKKNEIITAQKNEIISTQIVSSEYYINNPNFALTKQKVLLRIRGVDYQPPTQGSVLIKNNKLFINFDEPVWALTPGQPIVFYVDDLVVGGAVV